MRKAMFRLFHNLWVDVYNGYVTLYNRWIDWYNCTATEEDNFMPVDTYNEQIEAYNHHVDEYNEA